MTYKIKINQSYTTGSGRHIQTGQEVTLVGTRTDTDGTKYHLVRIGKYGQPFQIPHNYLTKEVT